MKAQSGADQHEIHYEETSWKARPDFSPDGKILATTSGLSPWTGEVRTVHLWEVATGKEISRDNQKE